MKRKASLSSPLLPLAAFVAGLIVLGAAVHFSRPPQLDERISALREGMSRAARLLAQPGSPGMLPAGAVCSGSAASVAGAYKDRVSRLAAAGGIPLSGLSVTAEGEAEGRVSPIAVRWKGRAGYESLVTLLSALSEERPTLLVEALDIKARQGEVEFELKGTVWCWTSANTRS